MALFLLLRPHGYYVLHANALDRGGVGVLLAGPSGSGKTTLTLNLIAAGWRYAGDDAMLVQQTAGGVVVHPLRRGFSCTVDTLRAFPNSLGSQPLLSWIARSVGCSGTRSIRGTRCELSPATAVVPKIVDCAVSTVEPVNKVDALFWLFTLTAGLLFDPTVAGPQLETLKCLVEQADCYRLFLGRDAVETPATVAQVLETYVETCP